MPVKKSQEQFIIEAKNIHEYKYDYSLINYINTDTKIDIICNIHGIFKQSPHSHLSGQGCPKCKSLKQHYLFSNGKDKFIQKSKEIHGDKYDYSLVDYKNNKTKVKIICSKHGVFEQRPDMHICRRYGCNLCNIDNKFLTINDFIKNSKMIHNDKYDYSLVKYSGMEVKVKIICPIHGIFEQQPHSHLKGSGCSICKSSKGELKIKIFLEKHNIIFNSQKTFKDCKHINMLKFDFYLPNHNICIEFDGQQHFEVVKKWGGEKGFEDRILKDQIKNEYCEKNNIKLYRIKYSENINEKMNNIMKKEGII